MASPAEPNHHTWIFVAALDELDPELALRDHPERFHPTAHTRIRAAGSNKRKRELATAQILFPQALAWLTGVSPHLQHTEQGKPIFQGGAVSISHSRNCLAVAIHLGGQALGLDIEYIRERAFLDLGKNVLSESELACLQQQSTATRGSCFYRMWTLREALCKVNNCSLFDLAQQDIRTLLTNTGLWAYHSQQGAHHLCLLHSHPEPPQLCVASLNPSDPHLNYNFSPSQINSADWQSEHYA